VAQVAEQEVARERGLRRGPPALERETNRLRIGDSDDGILPERGRGILLDVVAPEVAQREDVGGRTETDVPASSICSAADRETASTNAWTFAFPFSPASATSAPSYDIILAEETPPPGASRRRAAHRGNAGCEVANDVHGRGRVAMAMPEPASTPRRGRNFSFERGWDWTSSD